MECSSCGTKFTALENYEKHLLSEEHMKKMSSVEDRQNVSAAITSSDSKYVEAIKCDVCNLSFTSLESFQNHASTPEHAVKIMLKQANSNHELKVTQCKMESTEESVLPELSDTSSYLSYGSCKVCKKIFSGPEPYKQHIESQTHKKKIALQQNSTYIGENLTFNCRPCNKVFSGQVPYAQHMSSEIHKKKLQNIQFVEQYSAGMSTSNSQPGENGMLGEKEDENKLWFCSTCNIQCSGLIPYKQHVEGSIHFKNAKRVNSGMTSIMQITNFIDGKISEKSENTPQLITGNCQIDDSESKNSVKIDNGGKEMMQVSDSIESNISKKFEIMNGNYQRDNGIKQNDLVYLEKIKEIKVAELEESIKIIAPDEEIDFDKLDPKDETDEKPGTVHHDENQNN